MLLFIGPQRFDQSTTIGLGAKSKAKSTSKGPFILALQCGAVRWFPIHRSFSAATHRKVIAIQVKMYLTLMPHRTAVTPQLLCSTCGATTHRTAMLV